LVLDEPFNALDADACARLTRILSKRLQEGSVLVYTTHQPHRLKTRQHHTLKLGEPGRIEQVA
jgi:ABC-type transport system involved in cytochrome c biogenesis ATPase subunit